MKTSEEKIIASFSELLEEKSYNKISVQDIVNRCGIHRNTFYYHFQDIPSLLDLIAETIVDDMIEKYCHFGSPLDCIRPAVCYAQEHKKALMHIYHSLGKTSFLTNLKRLCNYSITQYINTATEGMALKPDDKELLISYYTAVIVGVLLDWLDNDMEFDLLARTDRLCSLLEGSGKRAFLKIAEA